MRNLEAGRKHLTRRQVFSRTLTGGKRYHAEKKLAGGQGGNRNAEKRSGQNEQFVLDGKATAEKLGEQYGVSPSRRRKGGVLEGEGIHLNEFEFGRRTLTGGEAGGYLGDVKAERLVNVKSS